MTPTATEDRNSYVSLWRSLRTPDPPLVLCIGASLVSGLLLAAGGVTGAWAFARLTRSGWVYAGWALSLATICWCVALVRIWRRERRGAHFVMPLIGTLAASVSTFLGASAIDGLLRYDAEYPISALVLVAGAVVILLWLPAVHLVLHGRAVVGKDDQVLVTCPNCDYSLIGLHYLRCPECGREYTIDEVIRAQHYGGVLSTWPKSRGANGARPLTTSDADRSAVKQEPAP